MTATTQAKPIILIIGIPDQETAKRITEFGKKRGKKYRYAVLHNTEPVSNLDREIFSYFDIKIICDVASDQAIQRSLDPYREELIAVTVPRAEKYIPWLQRIIPHVPNLKTPTVESLAWATSKIQMRERMQDYDKKLCPAFMIVQNANAKTLKQIEDAIGFPMIIKPTGLAASLLVNIAFHKDELEISLHRIFRKIHAQYKKWEGRGEPQVLVEQFMEGEMYSIDCYVSSSGKIYYCPLVHVKTGRSIGFDDFFGYQQITPTMLRPENIKKARECAHKAIRALALFNTTAHIELMRTEHGWKIIELGPRMGGFRDLMYQLSYGFNHTQNDIANRTGQRPKLSRKVLGYTASLKLFARKEGVITNLLGIKKVQELESFHSMEQNSKIGDKAIFAKHGGKSVFNIFLFNKERSNLLADIRRLEQTVSIETA